MDLFGDEPSVIEDDEHDFSFGGADAHDQGLKDPQSSSFFIGHDKIEQEFLALWNNGKMPHAFILNGIKGVGKATFAYRLARFILKESQDSSGGLFAADDAMAQTLSIPNDDPVFRKVASGGHPDIRVVTRPFDERKGRMKTIIGRDELRVIPPFFSQKSAMGGWQIVIIDDANMMSADSQNVVLKILEEPPEKSLILLVTHGVGGLIPTIRSRCRFVSFDPLSASEMQEILDQSADYTIMPNDLDFILSLANGSAGQAVDILSHNDLETLRQYVDVLEKVQTLSAEEMDRQALAIAKTGSDDVIESFLYLLQWWFDQKIHIAVQGIRSIHVGGVNVKVTNGETLETLLKLHEDVEAHIKTCQIGNLDKRYMIFKLLRILKDGR